MLKIGPAAIGVYKYQSSKNSKPSTKIAFTAANNNNVNNNDSTPAKTRTTGAALAAAAAAALIGVGVLVITKGKNGKEVMQKTDILADIPPELQKSFMAIKDLEDINFVNKAYDELVGYMNLRGVAPGNIIFKNKGGIFVSGGYNPNKNIISFSENFLTALQKESQLNMMAHELQHCKQHTNILRTEGITVEMYAKSMAKSMIEKANNNITNFQYQFAYNMAQSEGRLPEFLTSTEKRWTEELCTQINENFKKVLELPKIKADSPEGIKAYEDLKACSDYVGLGLMGIPSDAYKNNPLEAEAYAFGDKIEEMYKRFISVHGKKQN